MKKWKETIKNTSLKKMLYLGKVELFQYFLGQIMEFGVKKYSSFMNEFHWNLVKLEINNFLKGWYIRDIRNFEVLFCFMEVLMEKDSNKFEIPRPSILREIQDFSSGILVMCKPVKINV